MCVHNTVLFPKGLRETQWSTATMKATGFLLLFLLNPVWNEGVTLQYYIVSSIIPAQLAALCCAY